MFSPKAYPQPTEVEPAQDGGSKRGALVAERRIGLPPIKDLEKLDPEVKPGNHIKGLIIGSGVLVAAALAVGGYQWYQYAQMFQSTDDAYTTGHVHAVSSRISGTVEEVLVDDNQYVKKGQTIAILDPRDYQVQVDQASAALRTAQSNAEAAKTSIDFSATRADGQTAEADGKVLDAQSTINKSLAVVTEAKAAIPKAKAELAQKQAEEMRAENDYKRYQMLASQGAVSWQERDNALRDYKVASQAVNAAEQSINQASARLRQAEDAVSIAQAQLVQSKGLREQAHATHLQTKVDTSQYEMAKSSIHESEAKLANAQLQLSYTRIIAPNDGRIGKKTIEVGQRVRDGQQLVNVVDDDVWVIANFKETQLEKMRPGETVEVRIDAYPHHKFTGTVDSVSPGSGASFALLPPDNATGNFTKIVQRVPVKVLIDKASAKGFEQLLVPGMSSVVTVKVGK